MNLLIQSSYSKFIKRGPSEKRWMVIRAIIFRRKGKRSCWTPRNYLILFLNRMHLFTNQFQFYALSLSYQYLPFKGFNNSFNTNTIVLSDVFISKVWITRLTYNCAHLRSTKETLTIEYFRIILEKKIWVKFFWVKFFWLKIFWGENFLG